MANNAHTPKVFVAYKVAEYQCSYTESAQVNPLCAYAHNEYPV